MNTSLSIIVPIYNVENYLSKCLDSLVNQTIEIYEILLIDDGSTDQSSDIAKAYAERYTNISYLYKTNGGLSDARNYGIEYATGEFVAFIDADDFIDLGMFEKMLKKQVENDADIVACDMKYVYENGRQRLAIAGDFTIVDVKQDISYLEINNSACNKIYRKQLFNRIRFPIGKLYEDLFVVPILLYHANRVVRVTEPLYYYMQRTGSIVHNNNMRMFHIYEAIDNIQKTLEGSITDRNAFDRLIKRLLIKHGLFLTMLRIKNNGDHANRVEYFAHNIKALSQRYPKWYLDPTLKEYPFKTRVIFFLLKMEYFDLVSLLLKKE